MVSSRTHLPIGWLLLLSSTSLAVASQAPTQTQAAITQTQSPRVLTAVTAAPQTTAVTACHTHGAKTYGSPVKQAAITIKIYSEDFKNKDSRIWMFCIAGDRQEVQVTGTGTPTSEVPAQYTGCHSHGSERFCIAPNGDDVQILLLSETLTPEGGHGGEERKGGEKCHFHAGVEHCGVVANESEGSAPLSCERKDQDYNIPLRIGSLFVVLATSAIAVFGPMLWARFCNTKMHGLVFTIIKQFGTGIIVSTAFIHLFTHAQLMFSNPCLGALEYEATAAAIAMAGIFLSFLVEYAGNRFLLNRKPGCNPHAHCDVDPLPSATKSTDGIDADGIDAERTTPPTLTNLGHHHHTLARPDDKLSVMVMEAGILFHSIIIGVTLVVAGDSGYISLFVVIIFHQMFEGLALGARIAQLSPALTTSNVSMATLFALITPIGMAIGLGVIHTFNGNDRSTIIAIGALDALSAGILAWVALIDMWSHDWLYGDLRDAPIVKAAVGLLALVAGMVLMGLLGKWA
ncbi:hypothetical protein ACJ72_08198 [Emergomyces africanus]|uniref:Uncharacterized protein n=1 Tax=Emergomyces africanus TaxID=1955775 RepID=A0A1B7NL03_9EURO|nr:hypothetical protein ACJ72_08198 [Emergomyces africanus]